MSINAKRLIGWGFQSLVVESQADFFSIVLARLSAFGCDLGAVYGLLIQFRSLPFASWVGK